MRRKHVETHDNADRWLLTYSDMITLLMAFFIMMYSMSVLNLSRFHVAATSIRKSLGSDHVSSTEFSGDPDDNNVAGVLKPLEKYVKDLRQSGVDGVEIGQDYRGLIITIRSDKMLFTPGKAQIKPIAYPILDRIAEVLSKIDNRVQIEGHTCDLPPKSKLYETNWELSVDRATKVVRYFVQRKGLNPRQFSPVGHGDNYPVAPNNSPANRIKNRRVEIVILRKPANLAQNLLTNHAKNTDQTNPSYIQKRR